MLVETNKNKYYGIVYKLLKSVLILSVAIASIERVFSSMNYMKNKLRNRMVMNYMKNNLRNRIGNQLLNDYLVTFLEHDFFCQVKENDIIQPFQAMTKRRVDL